ncbi:hypothetical protein PMAYCL1PPCAC_05169, partial [Pristionchus mayeri]
LPSQSSIFPSHFRDGRGAIYISSLSSLLHLLFTPVHKSGRTSELHIFFILSIFHLPLISLHTFDGGVAHTPPTLLLSSSHINRGASGRTLNFSALPVQILSPSRGRTAIF